MTDPRFLRGSRSVGSYACGCTWNVRKRVTPCAWHAMGRWWADVQHRMLFGDADPVTGRRR